MILLFLLLPLRLLCPRALPFKTYPRTSDALIQRRMRLFNLLSSGNVQGLIVQRALGTVKSYITHRLLRLVYTLIPGSRSLKLLTISPTVEHGWLISGPSILFARDCSGRATIGRQQTVRWLCNSTIRYPTLTTSRLTRLRFFVLRETLGRLQEINYTASSLR